MPISWDKRLSRIREGLIKRPIDVLYMTDDELAQVIIGNLQARAIDISDQQLEDIILETKR